MKTGEIPDAFTAQGLKEAREVLRVDSLSEEDRKIYKRYLEGLSLAMSLDDSSRYEGYYDGFGAGREEGRAEGIEKGRAEGIEKGRAEGIEKGRADGEKQKAIAIARTLKSLGKMTIDEIAEATGLSPDELTKI